MKAVRLDHELDAEGRLFMAAACRFGVGLEPSSLRRQPLLTTPSGDWTLGPFVVVHVIPLATVPANSCGDVRILVVGPLGVLMAGVPLEMNPTPSLVKTVAPAFPTSLVV